MPRARSADSTCATSHQLSTRHIGPTSWGFVSRNTWNSAVSTACAIAMRSGAASSASTQGHAGRRSSASVSCVAVCEYAATSGRSTRRRSCRKRASASSAADDSSADAGTACRSAWVVGSASLSTPTHGSTAAGARASGPATSRGNMASTCAGFMSTSMNRSIAQSYSPSASASTPTSAWRPRRRAWTPGHASSSRSSRSASASRYSPARVSASSCSSIALAARRQSVAPWYSADDVVSTCTAPACRTICTTSPAPLGSGSASTWRSVDAMYTSSDVGDVCSRRCGAFTTPASGGASHASGSARVGRPASSTHTPACSAARSTSVAPPIAHGRFVRAHHERFSGAWCAGSSGTANTSQSDASSHVVDDSALAGGVRHATLEACAGGSTMRAYSYAP